MQFLVLFRGIGDWIASGTKGCIFKRNGFFRVSSPVKLEKREHRWTRICVYEIERDSKGMDNNKNAFGTKKINFLPRQKKKIK